jgi:hypothetical protein
MPFLFFSIVVLALDRCRNAWRSNKVILVLKNESGNFLAKKKDD